MHGERIFGWNLYLKSFRMEKVKCEIAGIEVFDLDNLLRYIFRSVVLKILGIAGPACIKFLLPDH